MKALARLIALSIVATLFAAGCSSVLAPQKDESQFFMLTASADNGAAAVPTRLGSALTIGLGPVSFPDYLKRPEVVTRVSADQLKLSENRRWAEPLDANFKAVLAQDLSRMLATQQIVMFPWYPQTRIDYRVEIQVSRMDVSSDGQSALIATWDIKDAGGNLLYSGATTATAPVGTDDPVGSAALSRDIGELASQIADRIRRLSAGAQALSQG
jgi:uncharacterized lipoprotein YmbA